MKKIFKSLFLIPSIALIFSCTDESLDPVKFTEIKKGTILALRGTQLDNIYFEGICGAEIFANDLTRVPKYEFEAEFLSEDKSSLASVDIFALKKTKSTATPPVITVEKVLVLNVPASQFTTGDYPGPSVKVSINVSDILTKIGSPSEAVLFDLYENGIDIHSDLNLTDGTKVTSEQIVAAGLFQSDQFYPAQILSICVSDVDNIRPVATTSQRGQVVVSGGKITRPIRPLKAGTKDTIDFVFDQDLDIAPAITMSATPSLSGTLGAVTKVSASKYYVVFTTDAAAVYTGNVTISSTGGKTADGLLQIDKSFALAVDNFAPQLVSFSTGTRVGKGGSATFTAVFNEKLATAPKITTTAGPVDPKVDLITAASMVLSADGLTATYAYEFKDTGNDGVHGTLNVSMAGGGDVATNPYGSTGGSLTIDLGTPPTPVLTLAATFDYGTQIKWSASQGTDAIANPGGSTSGTVYFMAVTTTKPGPILFGFGSDGSPSWTMPDDPASTDDPKAKVAIKQQGSIGVTAGSSGTSPIFTAFTANGTLDIYAVFVGATGNISKVTTVYTPDPTDPASKPPYTHVSSTPQLAGVIMN